MLEAGRRLGPYKLIRLIGSGGMGEVYRARDVRLDRDVAIKILKSDLVNDPEALLRFEQEAKAVAALSHPNILAIYDFNQESGIYYTASELLQGQTLRNRITESALSWRKAADIAVAVAQGLAAAHSKGIVHRDLKPENIFLTSDGQVKILDFGLAAIRKKPKTGESYASTSTVETDETVLGTLGYMSPEQVRGHTVDGRSDIFSLGCVLYEMLTGIKPFVRETVFDTVASVLKEEPAEMSESGRKFPPEMHRIVYHCLEKNPDERLQSAHDLAFELKTLLSSAEPSSALKLDDTQSRSGRLWIAGALLIVLIGLAFHFLAGGKKSIHSIAVLPFGNLTDDREIEYLSDGIPESIINNLSQVPQLRVMARSTVFQYKQKKLNPAQIGHQLKVESVLSGSIAKQGNDLTVKVELVNTGDGSQLWGGAYAQAATKLLPLQEEIAREIISALRIRLTGDEEKRFSKHHTENQEAYQLYLKGRYFWNKRTADGMRKAVDFFRQAIDVDPLYALAYSGLADAYSTLGNYNVMPRKDAYQAAQGAAKKALEIDEQVGEAHASLGLIYAYYWQWEAAQNEYRRAIVLNPGYSTAHQWYANFLQYIGKPDEAILEIQKAEELDPLSLIINSAHGLHLLLAHRYQDAEAQIKKALNLDPNFVPAHQTLGEIYVQQKKYKEAIDEFQKAINLAGKNLNILAELIHAYAVSGDREQALASLRELLATQSGQPVSSFQLAIAYTGLNMKEEAFRSLEKAYDEHSQSIPFLKLDPRLQVLKEDPRFAELLRKMGLTVEKR